MYLLHLFIIRAFKETEMCAWIENTGNYVMLFAIAFVIVYVLSRNWVCKITNPLMTLSLNRDKALHSSSANTKSL